MTLTQFAGSVNVKLPFITMTPEMAILPALIGIYITLLAFYVYIRTLDRVKIKDSNIHFNVERAKFRVAFYCLLCGIMASIMLPMNGVSDTRKAYTQLLPYVTAFTGEVTDDGTVPYGSTLTLTNGSNTCEVKYATIADNVKNRFEKLVSNNKAYGVYVDGDTLVTYYTVTTTQVRKEE